MLIRFEKFFNSETGKNLMSIILGLGLATLFRESCKSRGCMVYQSPPLDELTSKVYKHDGKCYKFKEESTNCDPKKKKISIA